jgi:hypothetical protein
VLLLWSHPEQNPDKPRAKPLQKALRLPANIKKRPVFEENSGKQQKSQEVSGSRSANVVNFTCFYCTFVKKMNHGNYSYD